MGGNTGKQHKVPKRLCYREQSEAITANVDKGREKGGGGGSQKFAVYVKSGLLFSPSLLN